MWVGYFVNDNNSSGKMSTSLLVFQFIGQVPM